MIEVVILIICGIIMLKVYGRSRSPVLFSAVNMILGVASLLAVSFILPPLDVTYVSSAFSLVLGLPAVLCIAAAVLLVP